MATPKQHFVLTLGRGYTFRTGNPVPIDICPDGQRRALMALTRARLYEIANAPVIVYLVAAAGREARRTVGPTMAALTQSYWERQGNDFRTIANTGDTKVWSTFGEIEWLARYLRKHIDGPYTVEIVAAPRQDRRVRFILRTFFPHLPATVVTSTEAPIPLYHEAFGYVKLWLYGLGLRPVLDWLRRVTARPIREQGTNRPPP